MINKKLITAAVCMALAMSMSSTALAGPWANPSGNGVDFGGNFDYANGGDLNGLYGEPFFFGNSIFFTAPSFSVNDTTPGDLVADAVTDTVTFDMHVHPFYDLSFVTITAFGEYGVAGTGSTVLAQADWSITELGGMNRNFVGNLATTPVSFPYAADGSPNDNLAWTGVGATDISFVLPAPHDVLQLSLSALVEALAAAQGSAAINMNFQDIQLEFHFIPEPGTLALLGLAGVSLAIRRRR
jgi:hypothetical protein